ncbi:hypothetical protein D9615_002297 [Tricholomella constricta]|uniref:Uncharacterized protein n=1 Tax=Tricholomella constricta TaxID=117010 RepID=A0A8H5M958_9AGAR|nr:hypothetical protein D9615_002297 [Tricholomella constricta]
MYNWINALPKLSKFTDAHATMHPLAFLAVAAALCSLFFSVPRAARYRRSAALKSSLNPILDQAIINRTKKPPSQSSSVAHLCSFLVAKQVLLIGPETTYHLHSLWLNALQAHENRYISCYGPESCTFHHVCRSSSNATINNRDRFNKFPRQQDLLATNSSIIRYVLSTSLHAEPNPQDPAYTLPVVDPETGIRVKNAYWLKHVKHANVIIMNRGPLPAPAWTYENSASGGNWSYADKLYLNRSTAYVDDDAHSLAVRIVNAALHTTLTTFLPSALRALAAIESHQAAPKPLLVWHGSWYLQARCLAAANSGFLVQDLLNPPYSIDPWSLYYNAQGFVYMQNHLMHNLLPRYGGVFHALRITEVADGGRGPVDSGRRRYVGDCLLYPPTTAYGSAMQRTFLSGLAKMVEATLVDAE